MNAALVVVDVQEMLIPLVWRGEQLADRIAGLAREARRNQVPVIALRQIGPSGSEFDPDNPGTRLSTRLGLEPEDAVIQKTATDGFYGTHLAALLAERDLDTIVLAGIATDFCVDATARSALSHGLDVVLVSDGHAPVAEGDPVAGLTAEQIIERHNRILAEAKHPGGELTPRPAAAIVW